MKAGIFKVKLARTISYFILEEKLEKSLPKLWHAIKFPFH